MNYNLELAQTENIKVTNKKLESIDGWETK
jgi:hypothetical protein